MQTTWKGVRATAQWEACVRFPYPDGDDMSYGFGHNEKGLPEDTVITLDQCFHMLLHDITVRERQLNAMLKVPVLPSMWDALIMLLYNWGSGNMRESPLLAELNKGHYGVAGELFLLSKSHKPGLLARREHERDIFWNGDYGDQKQFKLWEPGMDIKKPPLLVDFPAWIGG